MNNELTEKLEALLKTTTLSNSQQTALREMWTLASLEEQRLLLETIGGDPRTLERLYRWYEEKREAIGQNDRSRWRTILNEELIWLRERAKRETDDERAVKK